jgi:hypothetical protein
MLAVYFYVLLVVSTLINASKNTSAARYIHYNSIYQGINKMCKMDKD